MNWNDFLRNVHDWSGARGILDNSTDVAQYLKAVSEFGELCDAVVKRDVNGIKDAVGDTLVCLANVCDIRGCDIADLPEITGYPTEFQNILSAQHYLNVIGGSVERADNAESIASDVFNIYSRLSYVAHYSDIEMEDCLGKAWDEIKDRKGTMVKGGVFIKDEAPLH